MTRVETWINERVRQSTGGGPTTDRFTVSLEKYDHFLLAMLADRLGMTKGVVAGELLKEAVHDAIDLLRQRPRELQDGLAPKDVDAFLERRYRAWLAGERALDTSGVGDGTGG